MFTLSISFRVALMLIAPTVTLIRTACQSVCRPFDSVSRWRTGARCSSALRPARVHGVGEAEVRTHQFRFLPLFLLLFMLMLRASFFTLVMCVIGGPREEHDDTVGIERWWPRRCRPQHPGARPRSFVPRRWHTARQRHGNEHDNGCVPRAHRPIVFGARGLNVVRSSARLRAGAAVRAATTLRVQRLLHFLPALRACLHGADSSRQATRSQAPRGYRPFGPRGSTVSA